jgi:hypothetical protein
VEKILPLLAPLASMASSVGGALASGAGMAARGIASLAGKTSVGRGIKAATGADGGIGSKLMTGAKAAGKAHMKNKVGVGEGGEGGEENLAGKFVAQQMQQQADKRQQANQQSMQNNQAMAEKAKANSEIKTGEPMEMSWRLLKDWHWNDELSIREIRTIVGRARAARKRGKHAHVHSSPSRHHDRQFAERYHPHQKMPLSAEGLEPHEIASAMGDLFLDNHPELKQALEEELPHPANPNETNTPGMVFHALRTDNPKISGNTSWDSYSPVIAKPGMFSKPQVHTAVNSPMAQAGNRHTIRVSSVRDYSHSYKGHNSTLPNMFNLVDPLSNIEKPIEEPAYSTEEEKEPTEADLMREEYRIRQLGGSEEKWRNKILDVEGEKSDKIKQNLVSRLATEASRMEQKDAKWAKQLEAQQAREQELAAREQGELKVELIHPAMPGLYSVTDPAFGIEGVTYDASMPRYDYYHNHFQNQQNVQTGEPMDLAWRLLKYDEYDEEENLYYNDDGTPRDPRVNPAFDFEENVIDDIDGWKLDDEIDEIRDTPGFHDGVETEFTPEEIEEKERRKKVKESVAGFLQSQKLASEPMSLAWRMLKQMSDNDMQEWAYENLRNQGITIPDERKEEVVPKPEIPTLYY